MFSTTRWQFGLIPRTQIRMRADLLFRFQEAPDLFWALKQPGFETPKPLSIVQRVWVFHRKPKPGASGLKHFSHVPFPKKPRGCSPTSLLACPEWLQQALGLYAPIRTKQGRMRPNKNRGHLETWTFYPSCNIRFLCVLANVSV